MRRPPHDYAAVFHASPDAILLVDTSGVIVDANHRAEILFAWPRDELIGMSVDSLVPPSARARHREHRKAYVKNPVPRPMGFGMELQAIARDGVVFPVEISLGPAEDWGARSIVVCTIRDLAASHTLRRVNAERVLAVENERKRIARELHDDIKQSLTAIQLHLAALVEGEPEPQRARALIADLQSELDRSTDTVDRIIHDIMPAELEGVRSLSFALRILCRRFETDGFAVARRIDDFDDGLGSDSQLAVFRIVQEALANAKQHSGTDAASVRYWRDGAHVVAEVRDAGVGFAPDRAERHRSLGLAGMKDRATIARGQLTVDGLPGRGTTVTVRVPAGIAAPVDPGREADGAEPHGSRE